MKKINFDEKKYHTEDIKSIFLDLLEYYNISYILLSEYLGAKGGDIDIYIHPDSYENFLNITNKNGFYKQKYIADYENHYFFYFFYENYRPLRVHIKYDLSFYDKIDNVYRYANFENKIKDNLVKTDSGYIAGYFLSIFLYAAKCVFLEKQKLELRQIESLKLYIEKFIDKISNIHEKELIQSIKNTVDNIQNKENFIEVVLKLREDLLPFFQHTSKGKSLKKNLFNKFKRFGKSKFSVLFLGPDGSGKTTTIDFIKKELDLPVRTLYGGVGSTGWIFPSIYTFRESNKKANFIKKALVNRFFLYILYPVELFLRTLKASFSGKRCLLLIDRCPELLIKSKLINKLHKYIFPIPDLVVILKAPANVLVCRKPEELNLELAAQKLINEERLAKFYEKKGSFVISIDTSKIVLENSKKIIEKEIWNSKKFKEALFERNTN